MASLDLIASARLRVNTEWVTTGLIHMTRSLAVLWILAACAGCNAIDVLMPGRVDGSNTLVEIQTLPPEYARWWGEVEACSGRSGDLSRVHWSIVQGDTIRVTDGSEGVLGHSDWDAHTIALTKGAWQYKAVVAHEMLHELLQRSNLTTDQHGHPKALFGKRDGTMYGYVGGTCSGVLSSHELTHARFWCGTSWTDQQAINDDHPCVGVPQGR